MDLRCSVKATNKVLGILSGWLARSHLQYDVFRLLIGFDVPKLGAYTHTPASDLYVLYYVYSVSRGSFGMSGNASLIRDLNYFIFMCTNIVNEQIYAILINHPLSAIRLLGTN